MTAIGHPALRGHRSHRALAGRRHLTLPGISTGSFWLLAALVTVLNMIGLVMVMSASSVISVKESGAPWSYAQRQVAWTAVGIVAMFSTLAISIDFWRRHVRLLLATAFVLLVAVLIPGVGISANGATRWIGAGGFQLQPSEVAKFALLLFCADLLDRRSAHVDDWRWTLLPVVAYLGAASGLIMLQPNLGTTIIIVAMVVVMLATAGVRMMPLAITAGIGAVGASAFVFMTPFRRTRFMMFLDPKADPLNSGLQNMQSMVAMANGGIFGRGLGRSTVKWGFLPYAWTDFIFAVIGEELGLLGAMVVVLLFVGFAGVGTWVAARAETRFTMLVAMGITAWITVQAFMNIGAVVGLMPITGVPLPFVSFGGSALVVNLAAAGMLMNIARHPAPTEGSGTVRTGRLKARR